MFTLTNKKDELTINIHEKWNSNCSCVVEDKCKRISHWIQGWRGFISTYPSQTPHTGICSWIEASWTLLPPQTPKGLQGNWVLIFRYFIFSFLNPLYSDFRDSLPVDPPWEDWGAVVGGEERAAEQILCPSPHWCLEQPVQPVAVPIFQGYSHLGASLPVRSRSPPWQRHKLIFDGIWRWGALSEHWEWGALTNTRSFYHSNPSSFPKQ